MTLFIDVENKKLVQSLTSDRSVPAPIFMQGDNEPLEIFLLQKGGESLYEVKPLVVGTDFLRVAIARFKGYPKSLTYAAGYALNPNGGAEVVLPLNTTAIENAVQESEYITAFLEVEYSDTAGRIVTILQTACRLKNDLIENAPALNAGMAYNIYPHKGINNYFSSIDVMPMYSCSCGGTIDLIFTKTD